MNNDRARRKREQRRQQRQRVAEHETQITQLGRDERIKRMLSILDRIRALTGEYEHVALMKPGESPLGQGFDGPSYKSNSSLYDVVRDAYGDFLERWPPESMDEVRQLPRAVRPEALFLFAHRLIEPDLAGSFFSREHLWPHEWCHQIIDDHSVQTADQVHERHTELFTALMATKHCCKCGGPIPANNDFWWTGHGATDSIAGDSSDFTCAQCGDQPHNEEPYDELTFLHRVTVKKLQPIF